MKTKYIRSHCAYPIVVTHKKASGLREADLVSRIATNGGAGQTVFAYLMPLRYLECAETRW